MKILKFKLSVPVGLGLQLTWWVRHRKECNLRSKTLLNSKHSFTIFDNSKSLPHPLRLRKPQQRIGPSDRELLVAEIYEDYTC